MTVLKLSYRAIHESLHVYLNGVEQYEPADWVYDEDAAIVTSTTSMDTRVGDLLEARYAHYGDTAPALVPTPGPSSHFEHDSPPIHTVTLSTTPTTATVMVAVMSLDSFGWSPASSTMSGGGATWVQVGYLDGVNCNRGIEVWVGYGFNGTSAAITYTSTGSYYVVGNFQHLVCDRVPTAVAISHSTPSESPTASVTSPVHTVSGDAGDTVIVAVVTDNTMGSPNTVTNQVGTATWSLSAQDNGTVAKTAYAAIGLQASSGLVGAAITRSTSQYMLAMAVRIAVS